MPVKNPERQRLIVNIASLSAWHPDDPRIPEFKAELATLRLIETIGKTMASVVLNPDQRRRITEALYTRLDRA